MIKQFYFFILLCFIIVSFSEAPLVLAARIRMNKVKEAPKVCSLMDEDKYLSKSDKRVFGTLRNSLVFDEQITLISDLGKSMCQWSYDQWLKLGDLTRYHFYIDEQRNKLYPYVKLDSKYQIFEISLEDCDINQISLSHELNFPKCVKPSSKKKKSAKKKRTA